MAIGNGGQQYPPGNPNNYPYYPFTPQNTGVEEKVSYNSNSNFKRWKNSMVVHSGTFELGHGTYTAYQGANTFSYDNVAYFHSVDSLPIGSDYYKIVSDTLQIVPYLPGRFSGSYSFPEGGAKYLVQY